MADALTTPLGASWPKPPPSWTHDDTEAWLTENPLPVHFRWPHRDALANGEENLMAPLPKYNLENYGKWLHETPYFPGLFEEIHAVLLQMGAELPDSAEDLARRLDERRRARGRQDKFSL